VDIAHVDVSASKSTGSAFQRTDKKDLGSNTTVTNDVQAGTANVSMNAKAGANDKGVYANTNVHGEATALKDHVQVKNETKLPGGMSSENKLDGNLFVGAKGDGSADAYANKDGSAGAHVAAGVTAGMDANLTGSTEVSTTDEKGNKEDLFGGSVTLHGNAGLAAGFHGGFDFKDGKLSTDFGFNFTPGVGGGVDTKFNADFGNIAKEGGKIANELGKEAGDAGYQAQKQIGETLSGIQKFLGGIHLFG